MQTQPANGTLAGAVTKFDSATPARFPLAPQTVLGFQVTVTVTAVRSVWLFGDGQTADANADGAAEHVYRAAGPMPVSLRRSYTGTFTIAGGAEVYDLQGVAEVPGEPKVLPVEQARTQLEAGSPS